MILIEIEKVYGFVSLQRFHSVYFSVGLEHMCAIFDFLHFFGSCAPYSLHVSALLYLPLVVGWCG